MRFGCGLEPATPGRVTLFWCLRALIRVSSIRITVAHGADRGTEPCKRSAKDSDLRYAVLCVGIWSKVVDERLNEEGGVPW